MRNVIETAAARTFYLSAWGQFMEERGRTFPGQRLEDVAPPATHPAAKRAATRLVREMEAANGAPLDELFRRACVADHPNDAASAAAMVADAEQARLFGHYTAMEAMGDGVSWADDHADPGLQVPSIEFSSLYIERTWNEAETAAWAEIERRGRIAVVSAGGDGQPPVCGADKIDQTALFAIEFLNEDGTIRTLERLRALEAYLRDQQTPIALVIDPAPEATPGPRQ